MASVTDLAARRSDADVVRLSWDEPEAFEEIFRRHHETVYRYIARRVGPDTGAELAAEVFVRAFSGRHRYRLEYASARPWLFGIAMNLMRQHMRRGVRALRAQARLTAITDPWSEDDTVAAVERITAEAGARQVVERLNRLRAREREVLLLWAFADLTYQEIAKTLGIPTGTVRSRLARARQRFQDLADAI